MTNSHPVHNQTARQTGRQSLSFFLAAAVLLSSGPALAGVKDLNAATLRADLAKTAGCPVGNVLSVRGFDVHGVQGITGFSVGLYHGKNTAWKYPLVVVYLKRGGRSLMTGVSLPGADSIAPTALVDLDAGTSRPRLTGWHGTHGGRRSFGKLGRRLQNPALLVETVRTGRGYAERVLYIISLKPADKPEIMARIETVRHHASPAGPVSRARGPLPRFSGSRVTSITFTHRAGIIEMIVTKRRTASPYSRCLRPKSHRIRYRLENRRFHRLQDRTGRPTPCWRNRHRLRPPHEDRRVVTVAPPGSAQLPSCLQHENFSYIILRRKSHAPGNESKVDFLASTLYNFA